jgi:acetylornithine/succinyldiaminopimelate/putrescine aminotransferase
VDFLKQVELRGQFFEQSWKQLSNHFPEIIEVRRLGMFMGIRMRSAEDCLILVRTLLDHGIFAVYANNDKRVL